MIFHSKYRCIECKKILDESHRRKDGSMALTCGCIIHKRDDQNKRWMLNLRDQNEVNNFNWIIDEFFVRNDLKKDSFIYSQLYYDR